MQRCRGDTEEPEQEWLYTSQASLWPWEIEPAERRPCPPSGLHLQLQEAGAAAQ